MIRTILKDKLQSLTKELNANKDKLNEIEELRQSKIDLINAKNTIKGSMKLSIFIGICLVMLGVIGAASLTNPTNVTNIGLIINRLCLGLDFSIFAYSVNKFAKCIKTLHKFGYKLKDMKGKIHNEYYIRTNKINEDLDREICVPKFDLLKREEEIQNETKILWDILQSEDLIEKLTEYDALYKTKREFYERENMPLIKDCLVQEWEEYLEYVSKIKTEDVHFPNAIEEHIGIKTEKETNDKKKTLNKSHPLAIYE